MKNSKFMQKYGDIIGIFFVLWVMIIGTLSSGFRYMTLNFFGMSLVFYVMAVSWVIYVASFQPQRAIMSMLFPAYLFFFWSKNTELNSFMLKIVQSELKSRESK